MEESQPVPLSKWADDGHHLGGASCAYLGGYLARTIDSGLSWPRWLRLRAGWAILRRQILDRHIIETTHDLCRREVPQIRHHRRHLGEQESGRVRKPPVWVQFSMEFHRRIAVGASHDRPQVRPGEPRLPEIPHAQPELEAVVRDSLPVLRQESVEAEDSPSDTSSDVS